MDITTSIMTIPFIVAHPIILVVIVPALFWFASHAMAWWAKPPTTTSNAVWKAVYPFLNTFIAANYFKSANAPIDKELDEVLATVVPTVVSSNTANTVLTSTSVKG